MKTMADNNGGSFLGATFLGILIGGALGAAFGLLFAPAAGHDTRRRIKDSGLDLRDRTLDFIDESRDRLTEFVDESRDRITELVEEGREEITEVTSGLRGIIEEGKRAYRERRRELLSEAEEAVEEEEPAEVPQAAPTDEPATS